MISDLDFKKYFGEDVPILKYSELENFKNIEELLPNNRDYKIILTESKFNEGHWCCLMRYDNVIEWFDSYGKKGGHPEGQLSFIPGIIKKMLGQNKHHLTRLLKTVPKDYKVVFNNTPLQVLREGVNTCGKWCIARIQSMKLGYTLEDFIDLLNRTCDDTGKPYDIVICDWI